MTRNRPMEPYLSDPDVTLYCGDALEVLRELPDESVHCIATSPPFYALRDYGVDGQIGLEATPEEWAQRLVEVFREARRVLRRDGTLWVECGDSYSSGGNGPGQVGGITNTTNPGSHLPSKKPPPGYKPKDLMGTPWLLAFALRADGWWLRGCNIWAKPNAMPESAKDRCTTAHSYVFQFARSARYFFDADAVQEPYLEPWRAEGRYEEGFRAEKYGSRYVEQGDAPDNGAHRGGRGPDGRRKTTVKQGENSLQHRDGERWPNPTGRHPRSVWTIPTQGFPEAHFATWPEALARKIILAAVPEQVCSVCGKARDPFAGSGTTLYVARKLGRRGIGIDLNPEYLDMAARRLQQQSLFATGAA